MKTSHPLKLSNGFGCVVVSGGKGGVLVVGLPGVQAVVEDADEAVEELALGDVGGRRRFCVGRNGLGRRVRR